MGAAGEITVSHKQKIILLNRRWVVSGCPQRNLGPSLNVENWVAGCLILLLRFESAEEIVNWMFIAQLWLNCSILCFLKLDATVLLGLNEMVHWGNI